MAELVTLFVGIIILGIFAQILENRIGFPRVLFLIFMGLVLGPLTGTVTPEALGDSLGLIVMMAVAIVVFEGSFRLELAKIPWTPAMRRIVIVGPVLVFVGTTVLVHYVVGLSWTLTLLIAALLIATGPTIAESILAQTEVRDKLETLLETEGIVNDITAEVTAVAIYEILILTQFGHGIGRQPTAVNVAREFVIRIGSGVFIGGLFGLGVAWFLIKRYRGNNPQSARLIILGTALAAFAIGEGIATEVGIVSAATAGLVLGNTEEFFGEGKRIPHEDRIEEFEDDLTAIILGTLFILLAALVDFSAVLEFGVWKVALVVVTLLALRPVVVFLATIGLAEFTHQKATEERVFLSAVGPRGIIPASLATLFSVELAEAGMADATMVAGFVFLIIIATAIVSYTGKYLPDVLSIIPDMIVIVGGGRMGWELAKTLETRGEDVTVVEIDEDRVKQLKQKAERERLDIGIVHGDGTKEEALQEAYAKTAETLAAVTDADDKNLLSCLVAAGEFGIDDFYVRVNDPENRETIRDLDVHIAVDDGKYQTLSVETVSPSVESVQWIDDKMANPGLRDWLDDIGNWGEGGDSKEVQVNSTHIVGERLNDVMTEVCDHPEKIMVPLITHEDGERLINPDSDYVLEQGDRLTLLGEQSAIEQFEGVLG